MQSAARPQAGPQATIIVVTYQSRNNFATLARALRAQTVPFELVIADNASAEEQRPTAHDFPGARILQFESNLGFAVANNRAAQMVETPFIAPLNPDAFPEPDWLERLLEAAVQHPGCAAFGATQIMFNDPARLDGAGDCYHAFGAFWRGDHGRLLSQAPPRDGEVFSVCAAAALYRVSAWREAGGFDEALFCFGEDVDLGFRLRLLGYACRQVADACVAHIGGASASADFATFHSARNSVRIFFKNMPAPLLWVLAPIHIALQTWFAFKSCFASNGKSFRAGLAEGFRQLPDAFAARRAVQAGRTAPIARAFTWSLLALARRRAKIWR